MNTLTSHQQQMVMGQQGVEDYDLRVGMILPGMNEFTTQADIDFILSYRAAYEATKAGNVAAQRVSSPTEALPGDSDISVRAAAVIGEPRMINPPGHQYPQGASYAIGQPMPQIIPGDIAASTLQSTLTSALPYCRSIGGLPPPTEAVPGCALPMTNLERQWVHDMLVAEGVIAP